MTWHDQVDLRIELRTGINSVIRFCLSSVTLPNESLDESGMLDARVRVSQSRIADFAGMR